MLPCKMHPTAFKREGGRYLKRATYVEKLVSECWKYGDIKKEIEEINNKLSIHNLLQLIVEWKIY